MVCAGPMATSQHKLCLCCLIAACVIVVLCIYVMGGLPTISVKIKLLPNKKPPFFGEETENEPTTVQGNHTVMSSYTKNNSSVTANGTGNGIEDTSLPPSKSGQLSDIQSNLYAIATNNSGQLYHTQPEPYHALWVHGKGRLLEDRLPIFNKALSQLREEIHAKRGYKPWQEPASNLNVLWANRDDFLQQLVNFTQFKTLSLIWLSENTTGSTWTSQKDASNTVIQHYYEWIGTEPLCSWIRTPAFTKARWDAVYNRTCTGDMDKASVPRSIEPMYFYGKPINPQHYWPNDGFSYPSYFYTDVPKQVLYTNVIEDGIITNFGDVISGNLKLVLYTCTQDTAPIKPDGYDRTPIYSEVFVTTQYWGNTFFHKNLEVFPRIAPYIEFLKQHKDIKIHAAETGSLTSKVLEMFGLSPERIITGVSRAKIIYLPQGSACGFPQIQETQMLSNLYRGIIHQRYHNGSLSSHQRKTMVVIHRSGHRHLSEAQETERALHALGKAYGLNVVLYHDQQLPSQEDTMRIFNEAALVFAPHGAGLANVVFCEPGTYVVEVVCNPPHVNMCYQWTAHILGLRYHAIPSRDGCESVLTVSTSVIEFIVKTYLEQMKQNL